MYFFCREGVSAIDAVMDCAFQDAFSKAIGWHSAAIASDLSKCYEVMDQARLCNRARSMGSPHRILRIAFSMYASPRCALLDGSQSFFVVFFKELLQAWRVQLFFCKPSFHD